MNGVDLITVGTFFLAYANSLQEINPIKIIETAMAMATKNTIVVPFNL